MKPQQCKAFVQFSDFNEAQAALKSPEAVLGNRFIKVFWANRQNIDKDFSQMLRRNETTYEPPPPAPTPTPPRPRPAAMPPPPPKPVVEEKPKVDVEKLKKEKEDLRRQQLEQTKALLASLEKMKNVDKSQKLELMKRIEALTNSVATSIKKDSSVVTAKAVKQKAKRSKEELKKEALDKELEALAQKKEQAKAESNTENGEPTSEPSKAITKSQELERLQKRYESLKKMASHMGLDPGSPKPGFKGRGPPRKKRALVLDNRTSIIKVSNLPENLRSETEATNYFKVID